MLGSLTSVKSAIITSGKHDKRVVATVYTRLPGKVTQE
jgi:hypothetical protein